jgi:hypothetical protein
VMPVWHPAAILRDRPKKGPTIRDLGRFKAVIEADRPLEALGTKCVKCHQAMRHYDPDGVPWCQTHWLKWGRQWKVEREKWTNDRGRERVLHKSVGGQKKWLEVMEGQGQLEV